MELKLLFEDLVIDQTINKDCETICEGGEVDERYLKLVDGCNTIDGDLVIYNWTAVPNYVEHLSSIRRINGSLRITNTTNLGNFDYFSNLEEVGVVASDSDYRPAIEVIGNEELTSLVLPHLRNVFSVHTSTVIIIKENPQLGMKKAEAERFYEAAHGRKYVVLEYKDTTTFIDELLENKILFSAVLFFLLLLLIFIVMGLVVTRRKTKHRLVLPQPPYILGKRSRFVLESLVKFRKYWSMIHWSGVGTIANLCGVTRFKTLHVGVAIHSASLVCTAIHLTELLVGNVFDRLRLDADVNVLVMNNETFLNAHMLPLGANGSLPRFDHGLIVERIKALMSKNICVLIGNEKHPDCVIRDLPTELQQEHTYKYAGDQYSFILKKIKPLAQHTSGYEYMVKISPNATPKVKGGMDKNPPKEMRRIVRLYYYRWDNRNTPDVFEELLQLSRLCEPGKTICISNRRKEVFSMIHMIYTYIYVLKEVIGLKDAFQLHTALFFIANKGMIPDLQEVSK
ncbi:hypothetical protein Y032_0004g1801 [Ancylostoma ceylanicum]|uniref:Receptor L-domain domain-containing protein n=1 Tax=Ancylostoma ceylanicum TaxID=53326 RepID=A0A016VTU9_9BILA|nr:hypothetical protein Y032_0004g1801 [Ancylostoma ceylanicum]